MFIRIALIAAIVVCSADLLAKDPGGSTVPILDESSDYALGFDEGDSAVTEEALLGGAHIVAGSAHTSWDDGEWAGYWRHTFAVIETERLGARGQIRERYYDAGPDLVVDTDYISKVDCLDVDEETGEAWIGAEVIRVTEGPDSTIGPFPPVGTRIVFYADDNDGSDPMNPDIHGNIFIGWEWGVPPWLTCHDRVGPWFPDRSQRGKIIVR